MKLLIKLICIGVFTIPFFAKASIVITVQSPYINGLYHDNLSIAVRINSTYSLDTVKATVGNRSVILNSSGTGYFTGNLSLTGLPQGQLQIGIYAKDVMGNTQTSSSNFTFDSLPLVTVTSPVNYTAYQSKLHIKASVSDPGHINCAGTVTCGTFNISFTNSIDTLVDVFPGVTSGSKNLVITAIDSSGQSTQKSIPIFYDKSAYLIQQFTNTGQIIAFKGTQVLVQKSGANNIPYLKIYNTTDTSSTTISLNGVADSTTRISALFCNGGGVVIHASATTSARDSIYIWRNNALFNVCKPVNTSCSLPTNDGGVITAGNYLIWPGFNGFLYLTDVVNLTTTVVDGQVINAFNDLDSTGIVVYSKAGNIFKYNAGVNEQITTDGNNLISNIYPSIDNNNIVYIKRTNNDLASEVYLNDGSQTYHLGEVLNDDKGYLLSGGYIAYGVADKSNVQQAWLRAPDKTTKQLSFFSTGSSVDRLGDNGKTIFKNSANRYYYADSLTSLKTVSGTYGRTYYQNNSFYLALGGTLYKYDFTVQPSAPILISLNKYSAKATDSVIIEGANFNNVTAVTFGGVPAASFTVNSPTKITAVLGTGASGSVSVTSANGTASLPGFKFLFLPVISSINPVTAVAGGSVTITGDHFSGVSAVSFGGVPAKSYYLSSPTSLVAVVGTGATGNVSVTTPVGTTSFPGFTFLSTPVITSITPNTAAKGTTVTITGTSFTGATSVRFGGTAATSFTVNSPTSISAVVGTGKTGNVTVTTPLGTATLPGFTFLSPPVISSVTPSTAKAGSSITITGLAFTGATSVTFGGVPATSFTVNSPTSITAVVGTGATGNVQVTTPIGTTSFSGFSFLPVPTITAVGSTTVTTGETVILNTQNGSGYTYQWMRDGKAITGATKVNYNATRSGSYTVSVTLNSVTLVSSPVVVNVVFTLPSNNFNITATSATCKGSANGSINIAATQSLEYTATITGGGLNTPYQFTNATQITGLAAGTYNLCITVAGESSYQQCFTLAITEPKDLSVYAVTNSDNHVILNLNGGARYNITLNGKMYTTTDSVITLPLTKANNKILVTTDKICQGMVEKDITITNDKLVFPNPFENTLSLSVGKNNIQTAIISVYDINNKVVYTNKYTNVSGVIGLDLSSVKSGLYVLKLTADNSDTIFKLIKR